MNPFPSLPSFTSIPQEPIVRPLPLPSSFFARPSIQGSNIELQPFTSRLGSRGRIRDTQYGLIRRELNRFLLSRILIHRNPTRREEIKEDDEIRIASHIFRGSDDEDDDELVDEIIDSESSDDDDPSTLQSFDVPHEWQEIKEIDDNPIAYAVLDKFGPLAMVLYAKLIKMKNVSEIRDADSFLLELLKQVNKCFSIIGTEEITNTIENLNNLIPSISEQKEILKKNKNNSNMLTIFKILVDAMEIQSKLVDRPLFSNYIYVIIPYAKQFYGNLRPEEIEDIEKILIKQIGKRDMAGIKILKTKKEYIKYYLNEEFHYMNMAAGVPLDLFYL